VGPPTPRAASPALQSATKTRTPFTIKSARWHRPRCSAHGMDALASLAICSAFMPANDDKPLATPPHDPTVLLAVALNERVPAHLRASAAKQGYELAIATHDDRSIALFAVLQFELTMPRLKRDAEFQREIASKLRFAIPAAARTGESTLIDSLREQLFILLTEQLGPGVVSRLEEAATIGQALLDASPEDSERHSVLARNLSLTYTRLYEYTDNTAYLDRAIELVNLAASTCADALTSAYISEQRGALTLLLTGRDRAPNYGAAIANFGDAVHAAKNLGDTDLWTASTIDLARARLKAFHAGAVHLAAVRSVILDVDAVLNSQELSALVTARAYRLLSDAYSIVSPGSEHHLSAVTAAVTHLDPSTDMLVALSYLWNAGHLLASNDRWLPAGAAFAKIAAALNSFDAFEVRSVTAIESIHAQYNPAGRWAAYCLTRGGDHQHAVAVLENRLCRSIGLLSRIRHLPHDGPQLLRSISAVRDEVLAAESNEQFVHAYAQLCALLDDEMARTGKSVLPEILYDDIAATASRDSPLVYIVAAPWGLCILAILGPHLAPLVAFDDQLTSAVVASLALGDLTSLGGLLVADTLREMKSRIRRCMDVVGEHIAGPLLHVLEPYDPDQVRLITTGNLDFFPLHASPARLEAPQTLEDMCEVVYLPAAHFSSRSDSGPSASTTPHGVSVLADPVTRAPTLRGARIEASAIHSLFGASCEVRLDSEATTLVLYRFLESSTNLHLACHATFATSDRRAAVLQLSDGEISFEDLSRHRVNSSLGVVFAAGCDTARMDATSARDEVVKLPSALLRVGAKAVISAIWPLDDLATALISYYYYIGLITGERRPARALTRACHSVRRLTVRESRETLWHMTRHNPERDRMHRFIEYYFSKAPPEERPFAHPYYWAGLVCVGDGAVEL
jgi:hypothetical protein